MARLTLQSVIHEAISAGGVVSVGDEEHRLPAPATNPVAPRVAAPAQCEVSAHDAFDQLVAEHEPRVRRLAHRLLGWRERAEDVDDVVQDVFLAALKHLGRFRGESSVATWLTSVTLNRCRSQRRRDLLRLRWLTGASQRPAVTGSAADERIARDDTCQRVRRAVQALPAKDREVIVLFYMEGLVVAEIAELIGASRSAIDVRLYRARQRLKRDLGGFMLD